MNKSALIITLVFSMLLLGCLGFGEQAPPELNETKPVINETIIEPIIEEIVSIIAEKEGTVRLRIGSEASVLIGQGLESLDMTIAKIEIFDGSKWTTLGSETKRFDLAQLSGKSELYATNNVSVGKYSKVRLTIVSAKGTVVLVSAIPGVITNKKTNDLDLTSYRPEIDANIDVSEDVSVVYVNFNLENLDISSFEYLDTADISISSESQKTCTTVCGTECTTATTFSACTTQCIFDTERDCDVNATLKCAQTCGCSPSCETFQKEECRLSCENTSKSTTSECKTTAPAICDSTCKAESTHIKCVNICEQKC